MVGLFLSTVCMIALRASLAQAECTECCLADVPKFTQCYKKCSVDCYYSTSELRLVNGPVPWIGRIEISVNGIPGTVCDDQYENNIPAAEVICRILNYTNHYAAPRRRAVYGSGPDPIWLDDVECVGNETDLLDCRRSELGVTTCNHDEDAGAVCVRKDAPIEISLVGGRNSSEGRVQMVVDGVMGSICHRRWDSLDAEVICRMLNFNNHIPVATRFSQPFGGGPGEYWLDRVNCDGTESDIVECDRDGMAFAQHSCNQKDKDNDAGVMCLSSLNLKVYLINGADSSQGTVVLEVNGVNGTICDMLAFDSDFTAEDAEVVCTMAGFPGPASVASRFNAEQAPDDHQIWMFDTKCAGTEQSLDDCPHDGWGTVHPWCTHFNDARVLCSN